MIKFSNIGSRVKSFLKEVYLELKKVNWLNRRELLRYTLIVIALTFTVAFFLGGLDYIFTTLIKNFILYRAS
ncbi:preprotein translocase subunit SecE [Patescibacteria group bacterium]|nr:preprotein translocase subunit SecE [Patescibacteria group bacterium]